LELLRSYRDLSGTVKRGDEGSTGTHIVWTLEDGATRLDESGTKVTRSAVSIGTLEPILERRTP
jgi:hypothetical protein